MPEDKPPESTSTSRHEIPETLIGSLPRTEPQVLRELEAGRLRDAHYSAIGQVAAFWANFESIIDGWILDFADIDRRMGVCFTGQFAGSRPRLDAFFALARYLGADKKWIKVLEEFAKDAQSLGEQRNRAVHDVWEFSEPETPKRLEATARRYLRLLSVHVPTTELLGLVENIIRLGTRFDEIARGIYAETHPSPETSPPESPL